MYTIACMYFDCFVIYFLQIIVAGEKSSPDTRALLEVVNSCYLPHKILIQHEPGSNTFLTKHLPALESMIAIDNKATAYVCEKFTCTAPINEPNELRKLLQS